MWSKNSPLCNDDWYGFAVKLVKENNAKIIASKHFGGGAQSALQKMLTCWWDYTVDCSWKKIIDVLELLERKDVIASINEECKITKVA